MSAEIEIVRVAAAGDAALVLQLPPRIDPAVNDTAAAAAHALRARWGRILRDVVVGYCTVTVYFDPLRLDAAWLEAEMCAAAADDALEPRPGHAVVEVPVCYGGDLGPDLERAAEHGGISPEEVVALHTERRYRVYMLGFVPGFAYLAEVDPRIAVPRMSSPRSSVPAGSVGIAGGQTGIYPSTTPGGWNIVGRTWVKPYDPDRERPFLFEPGDTVQFVSVPRDEFDWRAAGGTAAAT